MNLRVDRWTALRAVALREAHRAIHPEHSDERFAERLGVAPRTLYHWRKHPDRELRPATQQVLKEYFAEVPDAVRSRFRDELIKQRDPLVSPSQVVQRSTVRPAASGLEFHTSLTDTITSLAALPGELELDGHDVAAAASITAALDWLVAPTTSTTWNRGGE